jgi:phosphoenolpyruvate carboxykinase (ATP)
VAEGARGPHPETIVLLTADAFGVLPPVSILGTEEVMYHFVSGFTSRLAGTEVGVTEPEATFSACFGAPFMSQKAHIYAGLLARRMADHKTRCILLNTGWSGGPYGKGERMSLDVTRALLNAALVGELDDVETQIHPILELAIPRSCPGVDSALLNPRDTWDDPAAYDEAAAHLRDLFRENFEAQGYAELGITAVM